jgi:hypothetical protein
LVNKEVRNLQVEEPMVEVEVEEALSIVEIIFLSLEEEEEEG